MEIPFSSHGIAGVMLLSDNADLPHLASLQAAILSLLENPARWAGLRACRPFGAEGLRQLLRRDLSSRPDPTLKTACRNK
jgi:hypothetical protein